MNDQAGIKDGYPRGWLDLLCRKYLHHLPITWEGSFCTPRSIKLSANSYTLPGQPGLGNLSL